MVKFLMPVRRITTVKDSAPNDYAIFIQNVTFDRNSGGTLCLSKVENITILDCILVKQLTKEANAQGQGMLGGHHKATPSL